MTNLKSRLRQRHQRAVDNADHRQQREHIAPRADADEGESPGIEPMRKERHGHAQAAVRAQLHHHAGQQHGRGRGRGNVARRRPGMKRPHARQYPKPTKTSGNAHI